MRHDRHLCRTLIGIAVLAIVALFATPAQAAITASGTVMTVQAAPTGTLNGNTLTSATSIFVWFESQVTLGSAVNVDHNGSTGTFNSAGSLTGGTIAAGTTVQSYYVHFDAPTTANTILSNGAQQFLTFDQQILGVEVFTSTFAGGAGDAAFSPTGLTYGTLSARGYELGTGGNSERFTISSTGTTWTLSILNTRVIGTGVDSIRIITAAPVAVPEPGTWALFALGALGLGGIVRRRRRERRRAANADATEPPAAA